MGLHNNLIFSTLFLALLLLKAVASLGPTAATTAPAGTVIPVWFDSSNAGHRDIQYHPEQPARITACVKALRHESCVQLFDVAPEPVSLSNDDDEKETEKVEPPARPILYAPFSDAELQAARAILLQTHEATLVEGLERQCTQARERRIADGKDPLGHMGYMDTGDTYVTTETWGVVLRATATWMRAVDAVMSSSSSSSSSESNSSNKGNAPPLAAFALTRPPGHHATRSESNGFCLVNFAAAAALYAVQQQQQPCHSVAILDWDVHYGQGVADIVGAQRQLLIGNENREGSSSSSIRYVSTHQVPAFPYMGQTAQLLHNNTVMTLPMPADTTWTCGYQALFQKALDFIYNKTDDNENAVSPADLVIVCAGYDALASDELASCSLTAEDFGKMTQQLRQHLPPQTKIMFGLEGGYQLQDSVGPTGNLPQAVVETVRAMALSSS